MILILFPSIWGIACLCLKKIWKSRFTIPNCQIKVCLDLHAGLIRGQNWKPRPPTNLFQRHESSGSLRILKWARVRKCVFWGKLVAPFCVKVWFVSFRDSVLEKTNISPDLSRGLDFRFDLYFVIWLMVEKSIFGQFCAPSIWNLNLEFGNGHEHTGDTIVLYFKVGTLFHPRIWQLGLFLVITLFSEKYCLILNEFLKIVFHKKSVL